VPTVNTSLTPITIATTGATGIGTATGLPTGVTAAWSANVITLSGTPSVTGTYTYTILLTGGCGTVSATGSITVTAFICGTTTITDINNNSYNTVAIGTQCWTKENLKVTKYNDGSAITLSWGGGLDGTSTVWQTLTAGGYVIYENQTSAGFNATNYGFLYNWYAATSSKKLCPVGWHVPTDDEWYTLTNAVGTDPGTKLKKNSTLWSINTGTDNYGFSAIAGGIRAPDGHFSLRTFRAFFWSVTEYATTNGWTRTMDRDKSTVFRSSCPKSCGAYVRCLKN
jgi:uncharacterized protein (TIGR02145 family)